VAANLTDIDQLLLKVWTPSARPYVDEAVACYRISATRAAIIAIWIAVCVDITEKILWLATSGDAEAQIIATKLANIIATNNTPQKLAQMLEFERGLIELAENKFEFVTHNEARQLERLKEDRGACAHPGLHPVLKTPSLVFLLNREVGHGATEVYARVQA
jgi:hypothetical protein